MNSLTVSMIVRDDAAFLASCLESVRRLAREIVIADTGSKDSSIEIARQFNARILRIPWNNDFAEARNLALSEARGDWILSLDADEQLDGTAARCVPALLGNPQVMGYQVTIRNYLLGSNERMWDQAPKANDSLLASAAPYPAFVEHEEVRLFRRVPGVYFMGRVHESVGPSIRELHGQIGKANFCVHNFGFVANQATKDRKNLLYREIGLKKLAEQPGDWQAHFELGLLELEQFKNLAEAHRLFGCACALNPHAAVAWFFLGLASFGLGLFEEALKTLRKAESCGHKTSLVAETRGDAYYNLEQFDDAHAAYEVALKRDPHNGSAQAKLGLALVRSGFPDKGLARLKAYLAAAPQVPELHEGLILSYASLGRIREAAEAADQKLRFIPNLYAGDYLRAASLWAQVPDLTHAAQILKEGLKTHPGNEDLQRALWEATQASPAVLLQSS